MFIGGAFWERRGAPDMFARSDTFPSFVLRFRSQSE
jgi:hypothetical protein